jgi:hypothetical protein
MGILIGFAPFLAFAVVDWFLGPTAGLVAGAVVSAALLLHGRLVAGRSAKVLEIGACILFVGLALYALLGDPGWSVFMVRLFVDAGLLLVVLVSIAIGRPFTLQYAREQVPAEYWQSPVFIRTNYIITAAWALAFGVMVAADLVLIYLPQWPRHIGILATVAALVAAIKFTAWYPDRVRKSAA